MEEYDFSIDYGFDLNQQEIDRNKCRCSTCDEISEKVELLEDRGLYLIDFQ